MRFIVERAVLTLCCPLWMFFIGKCAYVAQRQTYDRLFAVLYRGQEKISTTLYGIEVDLVNKPVIALRHLLARYNGTVDAVQTRSLKLGKLSLYKLSHPLFSSTGVSTFRNSINAAGFF